MSEIESTEKGHDRSLFDDLEVVVMIGALLIADADRRDMSDRA